MANKQIRTINAIKNIITGLGGHLLSVIIKFIVRTVFIHTLGKSYLGINGLFTDVLTMLSLTELGFDTAINFKLYKPLAEKDVKRVRILMNFYKKVYRTVGLAILGLGLCLIPSLPYLIRDYDSLEVLRINAVVIYLLYIFRSVSSYLFFAYRSAVIKADQKKYILDIADYIVTIVENVIQIIILVVLKNFLFYTATLILFSILRNLVNAVIAKKMYPNVFTAESENLSRQEILGMLKDCGALFVYKVNGVIIKATDNAVISAFIGLNAVGFYSNYLLIFTTIKGSLGKIYASIKASMGNLFAVESIEKKYSFFQTMVFLTFVLYGTAAVGVAICADKLIEIWIGSEYVIPRFFSGLIAFEILLHGLTNNLGQIRNVTGIFHQMWFRPVLSAIINLVVSISLVQTIGIYGVVLGTVSSALFTDLAFDPAIIHKYGFKNFKPASVYYKKVFLYLIVLITVGILNFWICRIIPLKNGWLSIIIQILLVLTDIPLAFVLVFRKTDECRYLMRFCQKAFRILMKKGKVERAKG